MSQDYPKDITHLYPLREWWSCELCQKDHEKSYFFNFFNQKKRFCSYKHAWHFLWRKIFGWIVKEPETYIYHKSTRTKEKVGGFVTIINKGWNDEKICSISVSVYPSIFSKLKYSRQQWAFQLTKNLMGDLNG
jgi:hypothetical protein